MQQQPTFNFGLTKNFFFIYRTLSMRQKTKNYRIRGSNAQKKFFLFYFPSHIPIWVWCVQKTRAKNSHAWAPLRSCNRRNDVLETRIWTLYTKECIISKGRSGQHCTRISSSKSLVNYNDGLLHCKKSLSIFPSPAGMSPTQLYLVGNLLIIPGQGVFG
jgi:hypothetical protein